MELKKREFIAAGLGAGLGAGLAGEAKAQPARITENLGGTRPGEAINSGRQTSFVDLNYKPRRFNKVIELWEDGQPAYYTTVRPTRGVDGYELGKVMCKTWADMINYDMEHDLFDLRELRDFMQGLADGGGTRSGHRMPVVFVTCPVLGLSEDYMLANSWVLGQILDLGVTGIQICHARDPKAVEVAAHMACRYPFDYPGVPKLKRQGLRGASAGIANKVWGMNNAHYVRIADLWPLNPKGEILFGLKIEDTVADANAEASLAVPGVAFAEWGPTDNNYWLSGFDGLPLDGSRFDETKFPKMMAVHDKVLGLSRKHNVRYLNMATNAPGTFNHVLNQINDGAMLLVGSEETCLIGREHTRRKMPI
jgi:4-hydroxy-2-oxoheptanedioate aldolase